MLNALHSSFRATAVLAVETATALPSPQLGPLSNWSLAVKSNLHVAGAQHADAASLALSGFVCHHSSTAVERATAAGAHVVGMANMDEFGMGSATSTGVRGAAYNPYSLNAFLSARARARGETLPAISPAGWLTPGGSSGGSAAAVATGAARAALGSDTGGSVRAPAAFCGVVGFKPTYGRISRAGLVSYASSLDTVGVFAKNVYDSASLLDIVSGADDRDETTLCAAPPITRARRPLTGMRIGVPVEYSVLGLDDPARAAWEWGLATLAAEGATIIRVSLPNTRLALPAYYVHAAAEAASNLARYDGLRFGFDARLPSAAAAAFSDTVSRTRTRAFGVEVKRRIMAGNAVLGSHERSDGYDAAARVAVSVRDDFNAAFRVGAFGEGRAAQGDWLKAASLAAAEPRASRGEGVDVLLTPGAPRPPWPADESDALPPLALYAADVLYVPASLARLPALTLPVAHAPYPAAARARALADKCGVHPEDAAAIENELTVPVALQLIGRWGDEATLIDVATILEDAANYRAPTWLGV